MDTVITDSALPDHGGKQQRAVAVGQAISLGVPASNLLGALSRAARRLLERVGLGLQRFDDNLWDGGDET